MNKKDIFEKFLINIEHNKLLTDFLNDVFGYKDLLNCSYIYRMTSKDNKIIINIFDNISNNRFNRYIFIFEEGRFSKKTEEVNNVFITYINVLNIKDSDNKLDKLIYLLNLNKNKMIIYGNTFLDKKYIKILRNIIK